MKFPDSYNLNKKESRTRAKDCFYGKDVSSPWCVSRYQVKINFANPKFTEKIIDLLTVSISHHWPVSSLYECCVLRQRYGVASYIILYLTHLEFSHRTLRLVSTKLPSQFPCLRTDFHRVLALPERKLLLLNTISPTFNPSSTLLEMMRQET